MDTPIRIAFVCPWMTDVFARTIWYALQDQAGARNLRLTAVSGGMVDHPRAQAPARRVYDLVDPTNFDGAILFTGAMSRRSARGTMEGFIRDLEPLPLVSLGVCLEGVSSVAVDQGAAFRSMVRHLAQVHGHRRFAFVGGPADQLEAQIRLKAFQETLEELGVPVDQQEVYPGDYTRASGALAVRNLPSRWSLPGALVCCNDEAALGALEECQRLGIRVPSQLAVTGFDDVELARVHEPGLTSSGQPFLRLAHRAMELLLRRIGGDGEVVHELVPARLFPRKSCGCSPPAVRIPTDKAELLVELTGSLDNSTGSFQEFAGGWVSDFLTAFEYALGTGNLQVLEGLWFRYFQRLSVEQERGLPFRVLFAGLETLYGSHPGFNRVFQENLMLAGTAESAKRIRDDQLLRTFFFRLQAIDLSIGQITSREGLGQISFTGLEVVGIVGLAVIRFGQPPTLVHWTSAGSSRSDLSLLGTIDYPALLPGGLVGPDPRAQQMVVALTAEAQYLGYAVFWVVDSENFVCDLLANQIAGALHRIELLERLRDQSQSLTQALDEAKRMQEQLVETEKVAALARLVAGVAHEINTPLGTGITGTSYLLDRLTEVSAQLGSGGLSRSGLDQFFRQGREALEGVLRNLMKAGELVQAFKGLGLDHSLGDWGPVDLRALFEDLGKVYSGAMASRNIEFRSELPEGGVMAFSQSSALVQVVGELLENAMEHAFPPGAPGNPVVILQVSLDRENLRLAVTDNGRGIDADERRHLFDPLFTTKRPQGHAGLGLHLAYQLVSRTLGGRMTVASEPGAGSCFLCVLPLKTD